MELTTSISTYYKRIIELVIELHHYDFANAQSGHCMKITGFGMNELPYLWETLHDKYPNIDIFIVNNNHKSSARYISATKLVELRNKEEQPLLVLIPSNSRTAAEDSYGNATFKEISLDGLESKLKKRLLDEVPSEYQRYIQDILHYLATSRITSTHVINYLIALIEHGYNPENIGNYIYFLGLIPDTQLILDESKMRTRLNFNLTSTALLSSFNKPLYDRVAELPLEANSLQKSIVDFVKSEKDSKTPEQICEVIFNEYPELNFSQWKIPDLRNDVELKLHVEYIKKGDSKSQFKKENDVFILRLNTGKISKLKVRIKTNRPPKDLVELKNFRIILMMVDGGRGEIVQDLRLAKNTASARPYRDVTFEINSNLVDEGTYFVKVLAEDEHGTPLNNNDDFQDIPVQRAWQEKNYDKEFKKTLDYKLTCDSEDFRIYIDDEIPEDITEIRKDKLNNVLQAYFKYRIGLLKENNGESMPTPMEGSNVWLNTDKKSHVSTFHINYDTKHNYQINLSTKLRAIEDKFLSKNDAFGYVIGRLNSNSAAIDFQSLEFIESELTNIVPAKVLKLRSEIFQKIRQSNESNNGIFETADIFNLTSYIKEYLSEFTKWTGDIKEQLSNEKGDSEEKKKLQKFLVELQALDIAKLRTKLPEGQMVEALLLTPLHPLRLAWFLQLMEVFQDWEHKTSEFDGYKAAWTKGLNQLFDGDLYPMNNPLVFVGPNFFKSFKYAGELSYGWGLYLDSSIEQTEETTTSVTRQLTQYFRTLLNINKENYVDVDVSQSLISKQITNYLIQHPYTNKLIINLINAGDAQVFADALVDLEKNPHFKGIKYEIRLFKGKDRIIEHGVALRNLINPEFNTSEEAEAFSQPSRNRLFPKLRFSINALTDYLQEPAKYTAHISFLISPFPIKIELVRPFIHHSNFHLNGLMVDANVWMEEDGDEIIWNRHIKGNELAIKYGGAGSLGIKVFDNIGSFISGALASRYTDSIPSTQLSLSGKDKVLLAHLHDFSDWVITFDKNIGPQIFDQPSKEGKIPFLLDYIPGEELTGLSSYLTTRPTSEVYGLLWPHFREFGLEDKSDSNIGVIKMLLEDLRAVSSSLVLQLNSSKNKAFEVIGTAFAKRVLDKKGLLNEAFLIPVDLHQDLFKDLPSESRSRADQLLVSVNPDKGSISFTVLEIKCRSYLSTGEKDDLKHKMSDQIDNTIQALETHFDSEQHISFDRLDREIKNKELKALLGFYIERSNRYGSLDDNAYHTYSNFIQQLDQGFNLSFKRLGIIFDFSATKRHEKEVIDSGFTIFTLGKKLIGDILDPNSDLNTSRLEELEFDNELREAIGGAKSLDPFIQQFKPTIKQEVHENEVVYSDVDDKDSESPLDIDNIEETPIEIEDTVEVKVEEMSSHDSPAFDIMIGKSSPSKQYGILGESKNGKKIAVDLSETNTISLFGVQGGGKSYTIGTISEMVLKQFSNINDLPSPLAGVIFHYSESMDYEPEFTSMIYPNDQDAELQKLEARYGAKPNNIEDVIILTPKDKLEERQAEYPSIEVLPIAFNSKELNVQDWLFLLGAIGNDSTYVKQLKAIMKEHRRNITLDAITASVEASELLSNTQKALAKQKLNFAREYIDDEFTLRDVLKPSRLIIVDLRDEFVVKDEALGLFVIMLNIFSSVKTLNGSHFNKFIVFDEAHKYMDNKDLTSNIVTAIREMRHKGVSIMIASQDPPSLPNAIIELSSVVLLHKFNSPQWLKHIQKSITQLNHLSPADMSILNPGEGFLWATKATEKSISNKPIKISTRPRVTKHGGSTIKAFGDK